MALKGSSDFGGSKLATTVREIFYTDEKIVAQSDIKKIGNTVEILVVEVDQQKYDEYVSSRLVSPAKGGTVAMRIPWLRIRMTR